MLQHETHRLRSEWLWKLALLSRGHRKPRVITATGLRYLGTCTIVNDPLDSLKGLIVKAWDVESRTLKQANTEHTTFPLDRSWKMEEIECVAAIYMYLHRALPFFLYLDVGYSVYDWTIMWLVEDIFDAVLMSLASTIHPWNAPVELAVRSNVRKGYITFPA